MYGDGSMPTVLTTAGVEAPMAFIMTDPNVEENAKSIERIRAMYPSTPIFTRLADMDEFFRLMDAGATALVPDEREAGSRLSAYLLKDMGIDPLVIQKAQSSLQDEMEMESSDLLQSHQLSKIGFGGVLSSDRIMQPDDQSRSSLTNPQWEKVLILRDRVASFVNVSMPWMKDKESNSNSVP